MIRVTIGKEWENITKTLDDLARKQIPYAAAVGINETAKIVQKEIRAEMGKVFDRPTAYTINSLYIKYATKAKSEALVWFKDEWSVGFSGKFGTPATKFMPPQTLGGGREAKSSELSLRRRGLLPDGMFYLPAYQAKLDRYGNIPGGQILQMLSSLGALRDPTAHQTARSMRRHREPVEYFVVTRGGQNNPEGIWRRVNNRDAVPFLKFIRPPKYPKRLDFDGIAERVCHRELPAQLSKALEIALNTAK